ncbi:MAG: GNAT family N-acetyltransferase [Bdellovibrionales bacterium]|nr:GNAT family N-acetyltransferase [Bdellovibrionales bacterium]
MSEIFAVREFAPKHVEQVCSLILDIQQNEFGVPITLEDQPDLLRINDFYQKDKGNFWVALAGEKLVGSIGLIDIGKGCGVIRKMFVDKNYRGKDKGIAAALLAQLLSWAKAKHLRQVYLGTAPMLNAAHRFYEKNGFVELPKTALPSEFPIMEVDTKFYVYDL